MKMKRLEVSAKHSHIYLVDMEMDIYDLIDNLTKAAVKAESDGYTNLSLSISYCEDEYSIPDGFDIVGKRLETDKEYNKRLKAAEKKKANQSKLEKAELKELARLKAKYEGKS